MNLANSQLKSVLDEGERKDLAAAISQDRVIIPALIKLLEARKLGCRASPALLKEPTYPFIRAAKDGSEQELNWLIDLLTTTKE